MGRGRKMSSKKHKVSSSGLLVGLVSVRVHVHVSCCGMHKTRRNEMHCVWMPCQRQHHNEEKEREIANCRRESGRCDWDVSA